MHLKVQLSWNVVIPTENLNIQGLMLQQTILVPLLNDLAAMKATKDLGYLLDVTNLHKIGEGKVIEHTDDVSFPVTFTCLSFKIFQGEVIEGVVHKILKHGDFMRCGPIENICLSKQKMSDYKYQDAENPFFLNPKTGSRIEKNTIVRCIMIGVKYTEAHKEFQAVVGLDGDWKEFKAFVGLEGDYLGPI